MCSCVFLPIHSPPLRLQGWHMEPWCLPHSSICLRIWTPVLVLLWDTPANIFPWGLAHWQWFLWPQTASPSRHLFNDIHGIHHCSNAVWSSLQAKSRCGMSLQCIWSRPLAPTRLRNSLITFTWLRCVTAVLFHCPHFFISRALCFLLSFKQSIL